MTSTYEMAGRDTEYTDPRPDREDFDDCPVCGGPLLGEALACVTCLNDACAAEELVGLDELEAYARERHYA